MPTASARFDVAPARTPRPSLQLPLFQHAVDEAIANGLLACEVPVAVHVGVHPLERLTGVLGIDLIDPAP